MPAVSEAQRRAMEAAAHGHSTLGIPKSVGEEFVGDDKRPQAAGIVFVGPNGDVLLLRRSSDEKNYGGHWGLPGGGGEDGETAYDTAIRETREEIGLDIDVETHGLKVMDRVETPNGMLFTTFAKGVDSHFVPTLDHEHTGYCWASLDQLPGPLHPSVARCLGEHIGAAQDMEPGQWADLRANFAQWTREEESEPEHAGANDSRLALDEASLRTIDTDGRMHVQKAHISKANVCPYWGHEIPGYEELKLDPDKKYQLFRSPEALQKAANTSNGVQLMIKHIPVDADDHQPFDVAGAVGTDAVFNDPYLDNSLHIWSRDAIDGIEDESRRELSCGYHYVPVMTPGTYKGVPYDGVMTEIVFNHVALVPEGRAGADVLVSDSQIQPKEEPAMKKVLTRFAGASMIALDMQLRPRLAKDAKIDLTAIFEGVTKKNFKEKKVKIASDLKAATRGKLAADAKIDDVIGMLDRLEDCDLTEGADEDPNSGLPMSKEDMEKKAKDEAEKAAKDAKEKEAADRRAARDSFRENLKTEDEKKAFDSLFGKDEDVEGNDEESEEAEENAEGKDGKGKDGMPKPGIDKKAMDAALKKTADETAARVKREMREVAQAYADVEPFVGKLSLGMDSAAEVYRTALKGLGMDAKEVDAMHVDALKPVLKAQKKPGDRQDMGLDAKIAQSGGSEGYAARWGASASRVQ